jgi:hypothetical protein
MKDAALTLLALGFAGAVFVAEPTVAAPFGLESVADSPSHLVRAANKTEKKQLKKHNYNSTKNFIPGHVRTPYGYGDCIGWWEPHSDGRMQCHGQLILDDMHNWLWD